MTKLKHPYVTVDCVVFGFDEGDLKIILIQRAISPFKNKHALPGGFVRMNEAIDQAAIRELYEETGIKDVFLEQLYTFGGTNRDPRGRVITVTYYALVKRVGHLINATTDAKLADWFLIKKLPELAFDHQKIIDTALLRLRGKVRYEPIGFELLPEKFTLSHLQHLYEVILERNIDKRNFRKKILSMKLLIMLNEWEKNVSHRAAQLYKFDANRYKELKKKGFNFEI
ncbi:MAG: NUDIX hydrolase [Candidatus Omnitrophica bacterium]|nr:NUDIX hydrolase [Candidatus Omnitrophota bacterium]